MKKVLFVIFVAMHLWCYEAIEYQEVRLPELKNYYLRVQDFGKKTFILESKPFHIVFEDINAITVLCWHKNKKLFFNRHRENFFSNGTTIIIIHEVTSDMSAKWKCHLTDVNNNNIDYLFGIRIKGAKAVPAFIDRTILKYTFSNKSVTEYDAFNEYLCEEGQTINLDCENPFKDGSLILRYYNANGEKMIETDYVDKAKDSEDKLNFRVLMRPEANRSYVECTYLTAAGDSNHQQEFTYRIIFIIRKDLVKNDYFTITINDMKLTSKPYKVKGIDIYDYNFIYGENLTITCENKKDILADIEMGTKVSPTMGQGSYITTKDIERTRSIYKLFVETTYLDQAIIEFYRFDSDSNPYLRAMINFYEGSYGGPAIIGLPASDMLYQYNKNNKEWIAHYQYTPNETVLLTCITIKNNALRWLQENKIPYIGMTKGENNRVGIKYISDMFTLNQNDITCQLVDTMKGHKSWTLVFHRKPDLSPMEPHETIPDNKLDGPQKLLVVIGSTVGVLLAILIIAIYAFYWYRRHSITDQKDIPTTNYSGNDNPLSNNGEYTYITNEYNYIESNYSAITSNSLYCRYMSNDMGCKRDTNYSARTENHYTEIDDYSRKNTDNLNCTNDVTCDNNKYDYGTSSNGPSYHNL